jgi:hypothetical protein
VLDDGQGFLFASIPINCAMTLIGKRGDVITHLDEAKFNQGHQIVLADGRAGPLAGGRDQRMIAAAKIENGPGSASLPQGLI